MDEETSEAGQRATADEHGWAVAANDCVSISPGLGRTDWVEGGDLAMVPAEINMCGPYGNVLYRLRLAFDEGARRMVVAEVEVRPRDPTRPLRSEDYRSLPIGKLQRKAIAGVVFPTTSSGKIDGNVLASSRHRSRTQDIAKVFLRQDITDRGGAREALSPEHLREVAGLYRELSGRRAFRAEMGRRLVEYSSHGGPAHPNTVKNWIQAAGDRIDPGTDQPYLGPGEGKGRRRS